MDLNFRLTQDAQLPSSAIAQHHHHHPPVALKHSAKMGSKIDPPQTPPLRDDLLTITPDPSSNLTLHKNISIPLRASPLPIRANLYLPLSSPASPQKKYPVLVTYGPYGKDIPYASFFAGSFAEVNPEHRSPHSAWETPNPAYWCREGYAVVRADERGTGQSPGVLDTMSAGTSECFFDVVEWCAEQEWSSGKVGLLGISYYAGWCSS